jgi:hypothetical protein
MKILHLEIKNCEDCPYFATEYSDYWDDFYYDCNHHEGKTIKTTAEIKEAVKEDKKIYPIILPNWCPLEDIVEKKEKKC